jgi:acyl carrier protein
MMKLMRQIGRSVFDFTTVLTYLFAGPAISTISFAWILKHVACNPDGTPIWSLSVWVAASPFLYTAWLVWFLLLCSIEVQIHSVYMRYRKPARATDVDGFYSWLMLNASLSLYLRQRFVMSLPLVNAFLPIQGLRQLVLLSYARSTHLGFGSLVLGHLFDPDITDVGENAIIGTDCSVIAHSITVNPDGSRLMVTSPIRIGARTVIGGGAQVHPGAQIGSDAVIEPFSCVTPFSQIGDGEVWGGNPARFIRIRNAPAATEPVTSTAGGSELVLDDATEVILRQIVGQVLHRPVDSVTSTLSARDTAAWDSLAQLSMSVELQSRFGITLTNQESFRLRSMASLRDVIRKQV